MKKEPFPFDTEFVLQQHQGAAQLGVPCALGWSSFQQNNRPCREYLTVPVRIFCLPPAQHTAACSWRDYFYYQWLSLSTQDRYFFSSTHFWGALLEDFLCVQHWISVPFLPTERLNGSHSVAFGDVTPQFGLGKDLKCAVPCTGETHWQVRFDGTSTKLSVLFPVSVLGLDTKITTLPGAETWDLPYSSELPTCATLC